MTDTDMTPEVRPTKDALTLIAQIEVVVTRKVSDRVRGFLALSMLDMAPGVYSAPRISPTVRERIWNVLNDWFPNEQNASIVMLWADRSMTIGQAVLSLGTPAVEVVEIVGMLTARR